MLVNFAAARPVNKKKKKKKRSECRRPYRKMLSLYVQTENNRVEENTHCISYYSRRTEQNNVSIFFIAQHVLMEFLQSLSKENLINDADQLKDFFLVIKNVKITHG